MPCRALSTPSPEGGKNGYFKAISSLLPSWRGRADLWAREKAQPVSGSPDATRADLWRDAAQGGLSSFACVCPGLEPAHRLRLLTALAGGFHKPEFALKSNTFAFIFFCLAHGERNMGGLYLNGTWSLPSCSSNSEEPEKNN